MSVSSGASVPPASGGVQALSRALELLEILMRSGGHLAVAELAALSTMPTPTVHRLLRTFVDHGFVRQLPNRRYALGAKLVPLGAAAGAVAGLGAEPILRALATELGETANLAVLSGMHAEYVAQAPSAHSMRIFTEVGRLVELHCTGVGKALLTRLSDDRIATIVRTVGMATHTPYTIANVDALLAEIRAARDRGYVLDEQEQEIGVRCIAVPVPSEVPMAVSVSGPLTRMTDELIQRAAPILTSAAERLASAG